MDKKNIKKSGLHLFNLFGFEVRLDASWLFLAILVAWTLAAGYFPIKFPGLSLAEYWTMGVVGALGLFLSIILHELCHSLVGRHYGLRMSGITLFIFGGVAEMTDIPANPKTEFLMALAGPVFSICFGLFFLMFYRLGLYALWPTSVNGVLNYLGVINIILAIFNLLPGFPLDGGRLLRSILWWWKKDVIWATRVASYGGIGLGYLLIVFAIVSLIQGDLISGLWMFLLGFFLQHISRVSYEEMLVREIFHDEKIRKYVKTNPIAVSPHITLQQLVEEYFYHYYHKLYPVTENEELIGCISLNQIKQIPKEKWEELQVGQVMDKCSSENVIDVDTAVMTVLQLMTSQRISRLIVTEKGKLYGIITLKDISDIMFIKMNLESGNNNK